MKITYYRVSISDGCGHIGTHGYFDNLSAAQACREWHENHPELGYEYFDSKVDCVEMEIKSEFIPPMTNEEYNAGPGKELKEYYARLEAEHDFDIPED